MSNLGNYLWPTQTNLQCRSRDRKTVKLTFCIRIHSTPTRLCCSICFRFCLISSFLGSDFEPIKDKNTHARVTPTVTKLGRNIQRPNIIVIMQMDIHRNHKCRRCLLSPTFSSLFLLCFFPLPLLPLLPPPPCPWSSCPFPLKCKSLPTFVLLPFVRLLVRKHISSWLAFK